MQPPQTTDSPSQHPKCFQTSHPRRQCRWVNLCMEHAPTVRAFLPCFLFSVFFLVFCYFFLCTHLHLLIRFIKKKRTERQCKKNIAKNATKKLSGHGLCTVTFFFQQLSKVLTMPFQSKPCMVSSIFCCEKKMEKNISGNWFLFFFCSQMKMPGATVSNNQSTVSTSSVLLDKLSPVKVSELCREFALVLTFRLMVLWLFFLPTVQWR